MKLQVALWFVVLLLVANQELAGQGCGWYLLKPPLFEEVPTEEEILQRSPQWRGMAKVQLRDIVAMAMLDRDAPISRWTHEGSFDTASACEQARQRLIGLTKSRESELRRTNPDGLPALGTHLALESRCIAAEDPRLARR